MLSTHSKLHQGRYRILQNFWSDAVHQLYDAQDELFGQNVVISETRIPHLNVLTPSELESNSRRLEERFNFLSSFSHEAIIGVRDHFTEIDRQYIVTDTAEGVSVRDMVSSAAPSISEAEAIRGIERILDAISKITGTKPSVSYVGITPANIRVTRENEFKLLFFDVPNAREQYSDRQGNALRSDIAFMPLEHIWSGLDLASQKAIANSYDDRSLDLLESGPDLRSDVFSVGSIVYFLLTGQPPLDALERSIEVLDGNPDPIVPPHQLNKLISPNFSNFIMQTISLRREDRFENVASAVRQLNAVRPVPSTKPEAPADLFDDLDLLEIPVFDPPVSSAGRPHLQVAAPKADRDISSQHAFVPSAFADTGPTPIARADSLPEPTRTMETIVGLNVPEYGTTTQPIFSSGSDADLGTVGQFEMSVPRHWMWSPISIAVALVVLIGISALVLFLVNSGGPSGAANQVDVKSSAAPEPVRASESNIAPISQANTEPAATEAANTTPPTSQIESVGEQPTANPSNPGYAKNRPAVVDPKPKQEAKTLPSETAPKTKKKVTVDDLINDN